MPIGKKRTENKLDDQILAIQALIYDINKYAKETKKTLKKHEYESTKIKTEFSRIKKILTQMVV